MKTGWLGLDRAHDEPMWMVWATRIGVSIAVYGLFQSDRSVILSGCGIMIAVSLVYLAMTGLILFRKWRTHT